MKPKRIFQLIDLDRTLFDTSRFAKLITDEVNKLHPGLGTELDKRFEDAYKNEETFFLLRSLRHEMGDENFEQLVMDVVEREGKDIFLLPGAKERLLLADQLSDDEPTWAIFTYGDEIDQRMKLHIIGLENAPLILTNTPDKGVLIRSWLNEDGTFTLPEAFGSKIVDIITFEDDKLRAFTDLPSQAQGIWITSDPAADARNQTTGENVQVAPSLFHSLELVTKFLA